MLRNLGIALVIVCFLGFLGVLVIITPDNALVQAFRVSVSDVPNARIITGPYPLERDFRVLKANGVTRIISLLNPAIYYEELLLRKERDLAREYGMELVNYPMGSILGQKFGNDYETSADRAAKDATEVGGKVYLHCYLGMHRLKAVLSRIDPRVAAETASYSQRRGERSAASKATDAAEAAYLAGDYDQALALLKQQTVMADQQLLLGWAHFKKNEVAEAKGHFLEVLHRDDRSEGANVGLGYVALRDGNPVLAERHFAIASRLRPDDAQAWAGLGLAHYRQGQHAMAARELSKSVELQPDNPEAKAILARLATSAVSTKSETATSR